MKLIKMCRQFVGSGARAQYLGRGHPHCITVHLCCEYARGKITFGEFAVKVRPRGFGGRRAYLRRARLKHFIYHAQQPRPALSCCNTRKVKLPRTAPVSFDISLQICTY